MKSLSGIRKADVAHGDDLSLTRWVKLPTRHQGHKTAPMSSDATGTRFPSRILRIEDMTSLLVSGHNNVKLGRDVRKMKFHGYWIYSLSLEERATCPSTCLHWVNCYGNAMPLAKRIDHTDPEFLPALEAEITALCAKRKGILIRLHALGDFFSVEYVEFWARMLATHANLAVYGYTARTSGPIMREIGKLYGAFQDRALIRYSDGGFPFMSTVSIGDEAGKPDNAFICPEQTGKTRCCATCGACWSTTKNVAFMEH